MTTRILMDTAGVDLAELGRPDAVVVLSPCAGPATFLRADGTWVEPPAGAARLRPNCPNCGAPREVTNFGRNAACSYCLTETTC